MATIDPAQLKRLVTSDEIEAWLMNARPGEMAIYHTGRLAADRDDIKASPTDRIQTIMKAAYTGEKAERGEAMLMQVPAPQQGYHYLIMKPSRPRRARQF